MRCRWGRGSAIRVNSVKRFCFPRLSIPNLSFSLYQCSPSYPCGVTKITSFSPNGHFGWQVHYTFYFQIVLTLLMPGRLIAWAWLAEKGLWHALGPWTERHWLLFSSEPDWGPWKERFYPSVLYPCLTKGPMHWDGLCHQRDSVNSSEQSLSFPPLFPHSCSPSPFFPPLTQNPVWKSRMKTSLMEDLTDDIMNLIFSEKGNLTLCCRVFIISLTECG